METSGLAAFLLEEYFSNWKHNRAAIFEDKWRRNMEAFERISGRFWKDTWKEEETEDWRSDTFIGITKQKILSAWSIVIDIFLQDDKFPFDLKPAPSDNIVLEDLPREERAVIIEDIEDMARVIRQQLKDTKAVRELMKCVMSGAIYGESYAKRFIDSIQRVNFQQNEFGRFDQVTSEANQPGWEYVSCFSIFRDYEIEDIQDCAGICQVDYSSAYLLRQSMQYPGFFPDTIEDVISEYASQKTTESSTSGVNNQDYDPDWATPPASAAQKMSRYTSVIPMKEFWARVPRAFAEEFEKDREKSDYIYTNENSQNDGDEVEIMALIAGDQIIRYARVEKNERPYFWTPWEIRLDFPGGCGVADNLEQTQTVLNGMVRAFEDNKKLSGNVILAAKESFFQKMGDTLTPGMRIKLSEDIDNAAQALHAVVIPDVGESLLSGIGLFERYADEESQLPKILQGAIHEKQKADTAFELNQLQTNAGKYLGGVVRNYDENLIEPVIMSFYVYNMLDPDLSIQKRNLIVQALGYKSYQDKVIRLQKLLQLFNILINNDATLIETNVRDMIREISMALSVDPSLSLRRPEEKQADDEAAQAEQQRVRQIEDQNISDASSKTQSEAKFNESRSRKEDSEAEKNQSDIRIQEAESAAGVRNADAGEEQKQPKERKLKAVT